MWWTFQVKSRNGAWFIKGILMAGTRGGWANAVPFRSARHFHDFPDAAGAEALLKRINRDGANPDRSEHWADDGAWNS